MNVFSLLLKESARRVLDLSKSVLLYEEDGSSIRIKRSEWRKTILPREIKRNWNTPDRLYPLIVSAVSDGYANDVIQAADHLLTIDHNTERATIIRVIIDLKLNRLNIARERIERYIKLYGKTGTILTNLAKVFWRKKQETLAEKTLWEALSLDPNQKNALEWWCSLQERRQGSIGIYKSLTRLCKIKNSWRPRLYIARYLVNDKKVSEAMALYRDALKIAPQESDVLLYITADLGQNGYFQQALKLTLPVYNIKIHGPSIGINILQICYQTKNKTLGKKILSEIKALNSNEWIEPIKFFSKEFES